MTAQTWALLLLTGLGLSLTVWIISDAGERARRGANTSVAREVTLLSCLGTLFLGVGGLSISTSRKVHREALRELKHHRTTREEPQDSILKQELAEEETRQIEDQAQRAQKSQSLNRMLGGLAHDFNNLLVPIIVYTGILKERPNADSEGREMLDQVELAAKRAAKLCDQMLVYAERTHPKNRTRFDLTTLIEETSQLLAASLAPNCQLDLDLAKDLPLVEADPIQLSQVMLNLVTNSSEALGTEGGTIRIRSGEGETAICPAPCHRCRGRLDGEKSEAIREGCTKARSHGVYFEVFDDGVGMEAAAIKQIFTPLFTTKFAGRGLGLAAVQAIVRSHHGSILIDSEPGSYTAIRITLPVARKIVSREQQLSTGPTEGGTVPVMGFPVAS
jgi:signal transduction histidine kinase